MKKVLLIILCMTFTFGMVGCAKAVIGGADGPTSILITSPAHYETKVMYATVKDLKNGQMTVALEEHPMEILACSTLITSTVIPVCHMEPFPEPVIGDRLMISYYSPLRVNENIRDGVLYIPEDAIRQIIVERETLLTGKITGLENGTMYLRAEGGDYAISGYADYIMTGPEYEVGDIVTIHYDGRIGELYPMIPEGVSKIDLTEKGNKVTPDKDTPLSPYRYTGDDGIEKAITEYFQAQDMYYRPEGTVMIPAFCIFKSETVVDPQSKGSNEAKKGDVKVYGNFWDFVYSRKDKTLFCESGGEAPGVIYLKRTGDNAYEVTTFDRVGDGSQYSEDIKRICNGNKVLEQQYYDASDAGKDPLKTRRMWYIWNYVTDNDLDINSYQDYGWEPVALENPSNGTYDGI